MEASCSNEPDFGDQWGLLNPSNPDADINICDAWQNSRMGDGVKVLIVDAGVDFTHEDLNKYVNNPSRDAAMLGLTSPQVFYPYNNDPGGNHGTHVAGIVAAAHNDKHIAGIAPKSDLFSLSIPIDGTPATTAEYEAIVDGIRWGWEDLGADVINCSWQLRANESATMVADEIGEALQHGRGGLGTVVVFAAGNGGQPNGFDPNNPVNYQSSESTVAFPANSNKDILCVGAVTSSGQLYYRSSVGYELDLVAPGGNILSTISSIPNGVRPKSGTSMAAPYVTGVAALLLSNEPCLTNEEVNTIIEENAYRINEGSPYIYKNPSVAEMWAGYQRTYHSPWSLGLGYGLLDAAATIDAALNYYFQDHQVFQDTSLSRFGRIFAGESVNPNTTVSSGDVTLHGGSTVIFQSNSSITLDAGFTADAGSNFTARIKPFSGNCNLWFPRTANGNPVLSDEQLAQLNGLTQGQEIPEEEKQGIAVFPNPSSGLINFGLIESSTRVTVSFYNSLGALLRYSEYKDTVEGELIQLTLPEGEAVVFVQICTDDGCQTQKIIQHAP